MNRGGAIAARHPAALSKARQDGHRQLRRPRHARGCRKPPDPAGCHRRFRGQRRRGRDAGQPDRDRVRRDPRGLSRGDGRCGGATLFSAQDELRGKIAVRAGYCWQDARVPAFGEVAARTGFEGFGDSIRQAVGFQMRWWPVATSRPPHRGRSAAMSPGGGEVLLREGHLGVLLPFLLATLLTVHGRTKPGRTSCHFVIRLLGTCSDRFQSRWACLSRSAQRISR